jgi:hypothetical protein
MEPKNIVHALAFDLVSDQDLVVAVRESLAPNDPHPFEVLAVLH